MMLLNNLLDKSRLLAWEEQVAAREERVASRQRAKEEE